MHHQIGPIQRTLEHISGITTKADTQVDISPNLLFGIEWTECVGEVPATGIFPHRRYRLRFGAIVIRMSS